MFDDYDDFEYEPVERITEEEVDRELKDLTEKRRKLRKKTGLYSAKLVGIVAIITGLTTTLGVVGGTLLDHSPLKKEDVVRPAHIKTQFSSDGESKVTKQYEPFDQERSFIRYYIDCVQKGDKFITCESTYEVTGLTYQDVDGFIRIKGIDEKIFGEPVLERIIQKDEKEGPKYEGVIYEIDNNDKIVTPQTDIEDAEDKLGFLVLPSTVGGAMTTLMVALAVNEKVSELNGEHSAINREIKHYEDKKKKLTKKL